MDSSSFDDSPAPTAPSPFSRFFDISALNASTVKIRDALRSPQQSKEVLTSALGNAFLLLFVGALFLIYRIMEHFVRPIIWALLVGAGLFPLKASIKASLMSWLKDLRTERSLLVGSFVWLPGNLASSILSWLLFHIVGLIVVTIGVVSALMVEELYTGVGKVLAIVPEFLAKVRMVLDVWGQFSADSIHVVLGWSIILGVPLFVLLRRHQLALTALSSIIWAVVILWVFPTIYAWFPTTAVVPLVGLVFFLLIGIRRKPKEIKSADRHSVSSSRTSSTLVFFLAVACFSVLFLRYLPYMLLCLLLLSQVNSLWRRLSESVPSIPEVWLSIMFPPVVRWVFRSFARGDRALAEQLERHSDSIATLLTLCVFIAIAATLSVWASVSVYHEMQELALNATNVWAQSDVLTSLVGSMMSEGQGWVMKNLLNNSNLALSAKLFNFSSTTLGKVGVGGAGAEAFKMPDLTDWNTVSQLLGSVRDSGQQVLTFALYSFYSVILSMTGLMLSSFIFFTLLFYLLAASDSNYVPFEWVKRIRVLGGDLDKTLTDAIQNVFHSTIMVAAFHGLFSWISFTLLGARWVAISTVFSFVFAALPFVAPFWCALPSAIELFYSRSNAGPSVALILSQLIIYLFVDPIIYSETGEHPYMTALAVVGGLYLLGTEGIVLGPLIFVIVSQLFIYLNQEAIKTEGQVVATPMRKR